MNPNNLPNSNFHLNISTPTKNKTHINNINKNLFINSKHNNSDLKPEEFFNTTKNKKLNFNPYDFYDNNNSINSNYTNENKKIRRNSCIINSNNFEFKIMNENNLEILADNKKEKNPNFNFFSNISNQNNIDSDSFNMFSNSSNNTNNAFISNSSAANNFYSTHPASSQSNQNNSNVNLENLTIEELKLNLEISKKSYDKKLIETENLLKEINSKDLKITELTYKLKILLDTELDLQINNNINYSINLNHNSISKETEHLNNVQINGNFENNDDLKNLKKENFNHIQIIQLKNEIDNLKKNHSDMIKEIEMDYDKELEINLNKLKENYDEKIREITVDQDKKIKELKEDIYFIRSKIDKYENIYYNKTKNNNNLNEFDKYENNNFINQPNQYLINLKKQHDQELKEYEKEIEKLENIIGENLKFPNDPDNSNFINLADIPYLNQNTMENYDIISMISQLETPTNSIQMVNKINNNKIFNSTPKNKFHDYEKEDIILNQEKIKFSSIQQNKFNNKNINDIYTEDDINEDYLISEEVQINKINYLKMENTINDRISLNTSGKKYF